MFISISEHYASISRGIDGRDLCFHLDDFSLYHFTHAVLNREW